MFALIDANSFYASAEQVFRPEWRGKPIIVLSNNDGCVVAANHGALAVGVKKFLPYFQVKPLCDKHKVIVLSSNYELYSDLSSKMMQIIGRFAPEQFVYSIDESFVSFKQCHSAIPCMRTYAMQIRRAVWKEARLPVCVGVAPTLTLAKVANYAAKKIKGYSGVCVLDNLAERQHVLKQMHVSDVWGIGRRISKRLEMMKIHSAYHLASMPPKLARKQFSIEIERAVRELNGEPCKVFSEARADKKQIYSTRSMGNRITDLTDLNQALCKHTGIAAEKARKQDSVCSVMTVFASNSPYDERPVSFQKQIRFVCPTNCTIEMTHAVSTLVPQLYCDGVKYYKVGVGLLDLMPADNLQFDLFNQPQSNPKLMAVFDKLNYQYGSGTITLAAQGIQPKWGMRRLFLTSQYTTNWHDIPKIIS